MFNHRWTDSLDYRSELQSAVESAVKDHVEAEDLSAAGWRNSEALSEAFDTAAGNTCAHTSTQYEIMRFTDNEDALCDIEGPTIKVKSFSDAVAKFSYYAYRQDLVDMLRNMDTDETAALLGVTQCTSCDEYGEWNGEICGVCLENEEDAEEDSDEVDSETLEEKE
tara:strand:- start:1046 stop:1543 length:498 start_codon:yes stop_codon:yes gene_type:complete